MVRVFLFVCFLIVTAEPKVKKINKLLSSASMKDRDRRAQSGFALQYAEPHTLSSEQIHAKNYRIINLAILHGMIHQSIQITFSHFTVIADKDSYSKDYCN